MNMDNVKLLTKIFYDMGDVPKHIVSFYEKENVESLNVEKFIKICEKYHILSNISELFNFLDFMGIKIGILPIINTEDWGYRIYSEKGVSIVSDFPSRSSAVLSSIDMAFYLYFKKIKKTEKNGN